jgi:hypothetical protein
MTECKKAGFVMGFLWANLAFIGNGFAQIISEPFKVLELSVPCKAGSVPNLFRHSDGSVWLSWVEYPDDTTDVLKFASLKDNQWQEEGEIARGSNWFVNWADFPSFSIFPGGSEKYLAAHWLQKSADGTFDYDVRISLKKPHQSLWTPSVVLHRDGIHAEHGFVSLLPEKQGTLRAFWLDGRWTKMAQETINKHQEGHDGHHGTMTLYTASIDTLGNISGETMLDSRVCDCCQTAAAMVDDGPVVVYRDRSEREIRDISIVRFENGNWTEPVSVYPDEWMIAGCPVNGPAIASQGNKLAIAWFTGKNQKGAVKVILSHDGGKSFGKPIMIDAQNPVGRVDIQWLNEKQFVVSWVGKKGESANISLQILNSKGKKGIYQHLMDTNPERLSGFPILVPYEGGLILSTTEVNKKDVSAPFTRVNTYLLSSTR